MGGFGSPLHWLVIAAVALLLFGNRGCGPWAPMRV